MIKVTFIGAGSTVFMKNILTDILLEKNFNNCEIVLQDIDERRLKTSNLVAEKVAKSIGIQPLQPDGILDREGHCNREVQSTESRVFTRTCSRPQGDSRSEC